MPAVSVVSLPLKLGKAEKIIKEKGFIASSYLELVVDAKLLLKHHNRDVCLLLVQMAPVYCIGSLVKNPAPC